MALVIPFGLRVSVGKPPGTESSHAIFGCETEHKGGYPHDRTNHRLTEAALMLCPISPWGILFAQEGSHRARSRHFSSEIGQHVVQ